MFTAGGDYVQSAGSTTLVDPSSVLKTSEPLNGVKINGGSLTGVGTVAANVVNSATVAPGLSPGTLKVDGDYKQGGTGILKIDLTKLKSDVFAMTGPQPWAASSSSAA